MAVARAWRGQFLAWGGAGGKTIKRIPHHMHRTPAARFFLNFTPCLSVRPKIVVARLYHCTSMVCCLSDGSRAPLRCPRCTTHATTNGVCCGRNPRHFWFHSLERGLLCRF
eukprot:gene18205-biopygen3919